MLALLPGFTPTASQSVDQFQKEDNQYSQLVWRHDVNASNFFRLGAYFQTRVADFQTDPFNALAYAEDVNWLRRRTSDGSPIAAGCGSITPGSPTASISSRSGFQLDYTRANNTAQIFAFDTSGGAPAGPVLSLNASNQNIQTRQELWVQDQWSPTDDWTFNLGVRGDAIQGFYNEGQISPRVGVTYKHNQSNVFHAYYGRLFTPPNVEQVAFAQLNTQDTTAAPENPTGFRPRAERSHYFEVGSYHALHRKATLELTGYYKLAHYLSDAGQFGSTPYLEFLRLRTGMATRY